MPFRCGCEITITCKQALHNRHDMVEHGDDLSWSALALKSTRNRSYSSPAESEKRWLQWKDRLLSGRRIRYPPLHCAEKPVPAKGGREFFASSSVSSCDPFFVSSVFVCFNQRRHPRLQEVGLLRRCFSIRHDCSLLIRRTIRGVTF